jgi:hypothetical protein
MTIALQGVSDSSIRKDPDVATLVDLYERLCNTVNEAIGKNLSALVADPAWGLLHSMFERVVEQEAACICLYSSGYFAPAEALCRTVVEGAVNLFYCSVHDSRSTVLTYFRAYIETERKQNRQWGASVESSPAADQAKQLHRDKIQFKEEALSAYESVLRSSFGQMGVSYDEAAREWPSVFDRFQKIGKEVAYRTVYAALCSQAHNDAEDLLNGFVHRVTQIGGALEAQASENRNFALYMVLTALTFLVEGSAMYLGKFNLNVSSSFIELLTDVCEYTQKVTERKHAIEFE